jgi:hypothetical protein
VLEKNGDDDATVEGGAEGAEGTACPYTAAKEALGFNSVPPTRPDADGNPAMIDSKT